MSTPRPPHNALFPGAGMGHLMPFLRLAAMLAEQDSIVTVITAQPTVSITESSHQSVNLSSPSTVIFIIPTFFRYNCGLLVAKVAPIAKTLDLPIYILSTTSVTFLSLMAYLPMLASNPLEFNTTSTKSRYGIATHGNVKPPTGIP
ncbi:hypothetical protein NL676_008188 [Syzygium grande]|nr:hypothetical protein NL676_008188 [Syzygium grande]